MESNPASLGGSYYSITGGRSGDFMPLVLLAFTNIGHAVPIILTYSSRIAATCGIKTRETWTMEPILVAATTVIAWLFAVSVTSVSEILSVYGL